MKQESDDTVLDTRDCLGELHAFDKHPPDRERDTLVELQKVKCRLYVLYNERWLDILTSTAMIYHRRVGNGKTLGSRRLLFYDMIPLIGGYST